MYGLDSHMVWASRFYFLFVGDLWISEILNFSGFNLINSPKFSLEVLA
jgi:hypothetical protein